MMSDHELERLVAKQYEELKMMELELEKRNKEVEKKKWVLNERLKVYARITEQKEKRRTMKKRLEELNKQKVELDDRLSQVGRFTLKYLNITPLFTKYNTTR